MKNLRVLVKGKCCPREKRTTEKSSPVSLRATPEQATKLPRQSACRGPPCRTAAHGELPFHVSLRKRFMGDRKEERGIMKYKRS